MIRPVTPVGVFFLVAALCLPVAAVPPLLSYQGRLTMAEGEPFDDGTYEIAFALYDTPSGGSPVWSETHSGVPVADGVFGVVLGGIVPIGDAVLAGDEKYLEVHVGADLVMPRTRLTSGAYALRVGTVDGATGGAVTTPLVLIPEGTTISFDAFGNPSAAAVATSRMEFTFNQENLPTISLWEPVDSKAFGLPAESKRVEFSPSGIYMFGQSEYDTTLIVAPNGDIVGSGQITMGENSSSGTETSVLGFQNNAEGDSSAIGGGSANLTTGTSSVISGGFSNTANGVGSTVGGGSFNQTDGDYSAIGGGFANSTFGDYAAIPGGRDNVADGRYSFAFGYRAKAIHNGSFVWADQTEADFSSTGEDQFLIRAAGGVGIGTDSPLGQLDVVGAPGDNSVNLPGDAIASPEILDEPGVASEAGAGYFELPQGAGTVNQIIQTTITIPADGYIIVRGSGTLKTFGTSKQNQACLQVDDSPGGGLVEPYYTQAGSGDHDTPSSQHLFSMSTERIFYRTAGSHTFYLEGLAQPGNGSGATTKIMRPIITALYLPTAYGAVAGVTQLTE